MTGFVDTNCHMQLKMEEALLLEDAVFSMYKRYYRDGFLTEAKDYLALLLKLEKIIKDHKGYETHKFSRD